MQPDTRFDSEPLRRLPGADVAERDGSTALVRRRDGGIRRLRHVSNWTLAALLVGVGASSASLARALPATSAAPAVAPASGGTIGAATPGVASPGAPSVTTPVATSSGSTVAAASGGSTTPATAGAAAAGRSGGGGS